MVNKKTPIFVYTTGKYGDGTFGALKAVVDGYATLQFQTGFYAPGAFKITMVKALPGASSLMIGRMIRVGDNNKKIGIIREVITELDNNGMNVVTVSGTEYWGIIGQRQIVPGVGDYAFTSSSSVPVETGIKLMISNQLGSLAETKRRMNEINIVATSGRGDNLEMSERYSNLLDATTRALTSTASGLFASFNQSTTKVDLDFYLGTDRSATVIFSSGIDTLESAKYTRSDEAYRNLAIVGGQGDGVAREIRTIYEDTEPEGINRQEMFVDARDLSVTASVDNRGLQKLQETRFNRFIEFDNLTYSRYVYGVNFFCGDLVTIREFGVEQVSKIISVTETYRNNGYAIKISFDKEPATITKQVGSIYEANVRQNGIF